MGQATQEGGGMDVLVTGGGGFIGQAVVRELERRGHYPAIGDLSHGFDVCDEFKVRGMVPRFDAVIHLAGMLGTHELFDEPYRAVEVNVVGTLNVLEACTEGPTHYVGICMPDVFPSVYTATKIGALRLASAYHHSRGVPVSHVRAFNAFGPGQAHGPGHPQKFAPTFAVEAWAGRPIPVWGDGLQTIDPIHVDDLARMLVDAMQYGDDCVFDGGTGEPFTVLQMAELAIAHTGSTAGVRHLPMRRGERPTKIVAAGEGWDRLGWRPRFRVAQFLATLDSYRNWHLTAGQGAS